jgi:hypothetical protein
MKKSTLIMKTSLIQTKLSKSCRNDIVKQQALNTSKPKYLSTLVEEMYLDLLLISLESQDMLDEEISQAEVENKIMMSMKLVNQDHLDKQSHSSNSSFKIFLEPVQLP